MRGVSDSLSSILDAPPNEPFYLDGRMWAQFVEWVNPADASDTTRLDKITDKSLWVKVFKAQLDAVDGTDRTRDNQLKKVGVELVNKGGKGQFSPNDEVFLEEVQRTYFRNLPGTRRQAELLLLARRHSQQPSREVNIISQHGDFERIPDVNVYYLPHVGRNHLSDFPADFDFLQDLEIHPAIQEAIQDSIGGNNVPLLLLNAYSGLEKHIKNRCLVENPSYDPASPNPDVPQFIPNPKDGSTGLIKAAFDPSDGKTPSIKLNPLADRDKRHTPMNEQDGIHSIATGIVKMFRNPLSHQGGLQSVYAEKRFTDTKQALKIVCFLSYLCERIDQGEFPV